MSAAAYKARLCLALLGVPCVKRAVDVYPGLDNNSAAFLALNPRGTVPVLVDGDLTVIGAEAILCHLAATHDRGGTWLPRDQSFAVVMSWLFFATDELKAADAARLEARGRRRAAPSASSTIIWCCRDSGTRRS